MPLDLTTFTLVDKPVTLQEGLRILERDQFRCRYCGLDGMANFENALVMSVDFVVPRARKGKKRSEEHTSELQSLRHLVCRLLLEKKKKKNKISSYTITSTNERQ